MATPQVQVTKHRHYSAFRVLFFLSLFISLSLSFSLFLSLFVSTNKCIHTHQTEHHVLSLPSLHDYVITQTRKIFQANGITTNKRRNKQIHVNKQTNMQAKTTQTNNRTQIKQDGIAGVEPTLPPPAVPVRAGTAHGENGEELSGAEPSCRIIMSTKQ